MTPLWEYGDLVLLEEESGFFETVWSRSIETAYEEYVERVLEAPPLAVCTGAD